MEQEFGWQVYAYAVLIWFTLGSVIATAMIWSTMRWNPINKILFGFMSALLFTFFIVDFAMPYFLNSPALTYGALGVIFLCIALVAARWRKPVE